MSNRESRWNAPDIVLASVDVTLVIALVYYYAAFVAPAFVGMFKDFGNSPKELPAITQLALSRWAPVCGAGVCTVCVLLAPLRGPVQRRALLVSALLLAAIALLSFGFALYAPIFDLAGNIKEP